VSDDLLHLWIDPYKIILRCYVGLSSQLQLDFRTNPCGSGTLAAKLQQLKEKGIIKHRQFHGFASALTRLSRRKALLVLWQNLFLQYILFLNDYFGFIRHRLPLILILEAAVVLIEWALLVFALAGNWKSLFVLSFAMNTCSYLTGVLIFHW
jgi:hypothetical protein